MTQTQTITTGRFDTPNASKYLQQLCKHFGHKIEATYDATSGRVDFPFGPAEMTADDTTLVVTITCAEEGSVERAQSVIDKHLERFAFRESFEHMDWQ